MRFRSPASLLLALIAACGRADVRVAVSGEAYEDSCVSVTRVVERGTLRDGTCVGPFIEIGHEAVQVDGGDYCFRARESTSCGRCRMGEVNAPMLSGAATVSVPLREWEDCDPEVHGFDRSCADRSREPLVATPIARALQLGGPLACALASGRADGAIQAYCWGSLGGVELRPSPSVQRFPDGSMALRQRFVVGEGFVCGPGDGPRAACSGIDSTTVLPSLTSWDAVLEPVAGADSVCVRLVGTPTVVCGGTLARFMPPEGASDLAAGGRRACTLGAATVHCSDLATQFDPSFEADRLGHLAVSGEWECLLAEAYDGDADSVYCRDVDDVDDRRRGNWIEVPLEQRLLQITSLCVEGSRGCLARGGEVWCWESCAAGLCAERVQGLPEIAEVSCGSGFTCGMSLSGADVWCWGTPEGGRLGGALGTAPAQICLP